MHIDLAAILGARGNMKKVAEIARTSQPETPKTPNFAANLKKVTPTTPKKQEDVVQVSFLGNLKPVHKP